MSALEIALKSRHCGGCLQTVDLVPAGDREARCPVCGRPHAVEIPAAIVSMPAARGVSRIRAA